MTKDTRALALAFAAIPLLLALALLVAELPVLRARAGERVVPSAMLDGESAWHARRVTLGLVSARFPQEDRFLIYPGEVEHADAPPFDAGLALAAGGLLGANAGGPGEGPPDERALEAFLSQVGPVLLLALLLALGLALRAGGGDLRAGGGDRRAWAVLIGLAIVALSPQAWSACAAGRVEVTALATLLLVVQFGLVRSAWVTSDPLDRLQNALLAGLVTGLGLASTPLFAGAALGAWGGFLLDGFAAEGRAARDRARAGLLFSIGAILPAQLPAMDGPWRASEGGPVAEWAQLSSGFLLFGCVGFGALFAARLAHAATPRAARLMTLAALSMLAGLLLVAPAGAGFARPLRAALRLEEVPGASLAWLAPPLALAGVVAWCAALAAFAPALRAVLSAPDRLYLFVATSWGALAACLHEPAGLLFLVPAAAGLAAAACARPRPARLGALLLAGAFLLGLVVLGQALQEDELERARSAEVVSALRWLRANSPASGAWMAAGAGQDYGVLAEPELAGLVPYHARRPGFDAGPRSCAAPEARARVRRALEAESPSELLHEARALGARYLLVRAGGPLHALVSDASSDTLERVYPPGESAEGPALYRLEPGATSGLPPRGRAYLSK